jgi:hypothetical protein
MHLVERLKCVELYPYLPLVFMAWYFVKHWEKFAFILLEPKEYLHSEHLTLFRTLYTM